MEYFIHPYATFSSTLDKGTLAPPFYEHVGLGQDLQSVECSMFSISDALCRMEETLWGLSLHPLSRQPNIFQKSTQADQSSIYQF